MISQECVKESIAFASKLNDKEFTKSVHKYNDIQKNLVECFNGFSKIYKSNNEHKRFSSFFVMHIILRCFYKSYQNIPFVNKSTIEKVKLEFRNMKHTGENINNKIDPDEVIDFILKSEQPILMGSIIKLLASNNVKINSLTDKDDMLLIGGIMIFVRAFNEEIKSSLN